MSRNQTEWVEQLLSLSAGPEEDKVVIEVQTHEAQDEESVDALVPKQR